MQTFFIYLALVVISYVLATALRPKPQNQPPASLDDFEFPQVDEGTPQAVVFGDVWCEGWMVLSYGNLRTEAIEG